MAVSPEDLACLVTVCETLANNLTQGPFTHALQTDTIELLDLIPQIIVTDLHPARVQSLLMVSPRPLAVLASFLRLRLAITPELRLFALKTLSQVINLCTSPETMGHLEPSLRETLGEAMIVEQAVHLATADVTFPEATAAAELLFVLCMKLPQTRADLRNNGLTQLMKLTFETEEDELRSYLCAIIRVFADHDADVFTQNDMNFVAHVLNLLVQGDERQTLSRHSTVLLFESLTTALKYHTLYWAYVQTYPEASHLFDVVDRYVLKPKQQDAEVGSAARATLVRLIHVEAASAGVAQDQQPLLNYLTTLEPWRVTFTVQDDGLLDFNLVQIMRHVVFSCHTTALIRTCEHSFVDVIPALCAALSPDKSPRNILVEAALIFGALCSKSHSIRLKVKSMVEGYGPWARHLFGTIRHAVERYVATTSMLKGVLLFDSHQTLLNDGVQAQNIEFFDEQRISVALLGEQTRREGLVNPPAVDQAILDQFYDGTCSPPVLELSQRLLQAIIVAASARALVDGEKFPLDQAANISPAAGSKRQHSLSPNHALNASLHTSMQISPGRNGSGLAGTPARQTLSFGQGGDDSLLGVSSVKKFGKAAENRAHSPVLSQRPPAKKVPFRPSSPGTNYGFKAKRFDGVMPQTKRGSSGVSAGQLLDQSNNNSSFMGDSPNRSRGSMKPGRQHHTINSSSGGADPDEYLMMAITMHLPITYGVHYNRQNKAAVRHIEGPTGAFVQQVHRNTTQTWSAEDVEQGELYVLFMPYHKICAERVIEQIRVVERHLVQCRKRLLVTPQAQKGRRWFLHDMMNYVLPKTELLLRDFLELVENFGQDDLVYQMGVIRLVDEAAKEKMGAFAAAATQADVAMPQEILRISSGKFKDVLHSGNVSYAVQRLREHYRNAQAQAQTGGAVGGSGNLGLGQPGGEGVPSQLLDIDREIQKLERRAAEDVWGRAGEDQGLEDDVESDYSDTHDDNNSQMLTTQDMPGVARYLPDREDTSSTVLGGTMTNLGATVADDAEEESLPPHMRLKVTEDAAGMAFPPPPQMSDFDSLYAAVENK